MRFLRNSQVRILAGPPILFWKWRNTAYHDFWNKKWNRRYPKKKSRNQEIFSDTLGIIEQEFENEVAESIKDTEFCSARNLPEIKENSCETEIKVVPLDSISAAIKCHEDYPNKKIVLLNFSDPVVPGGSVAKGAIAQEEDLCRCTTLYPVLNSDKCFYSYYLPNRKARSYNSLDKVIYSPNIKILKDDSYRKIKSISIDVISASAPCLISPERQYNYDLTYEAHETKARLILQTAFAHKIKVLILGAFGCGCFFNNPHAVVEVFQKLLNEDFRNAFEQVIFAVPDKENFEIFNSKIFNVFLSKP